MKIKPLYLIVAATAIAAVILFANRRTVSPEDYTRELLAERVKRDAFMKEDEGSPFQLVATQFQGLKYFPPNPAFVVKASLLPIEEKKTRMIYTSDNHETEFLEFAWAEFKLGGVTNKLLILEIMEAGPEHGKLFLSFADATSAKETYGAGRYLDLKKIPAMTSVTLDFNKAYNPYCAYSDKFSCPFPPPENTLSIAINAGEKIYQEH